MVMRVANRIKGTLMEKKSAEQVVQENQGQAFTAVIEEMTQAITMCIQAKMFLAGSMLMYAGVDIMGSFDRAEDKAEGTQQDFKRWATKYMLDPNPHLQVNADDLYGSRCGLLHAAIAESGKSRKGEAILILPVIKPAPLEPFLVSLDLVHRDDPTLPPAVAVYLDELLQAFVDGLGRFRQDVKANPSKAKLVRERAGKVPVFFETEML